MPYAAKGSFAGVPLWSHPTDSDRTLIGAMYLEFPDDAATHDAVVEFLECVGALLGGAIVQQTLIEETREDLRVERAKDRNDHCLRLDELLAPDSMAGIRDELMAALDGKASIMILGSRVRARHISPPRLRGGVGGNRSCVRCSDRRTT